MEFLPSPLGKSVPAGDDWFHELKSGGDRVRIERDGCRVRPITAPTGPIAAADRTRFRIGPPLMPDNALGQD